MLPTAAVPVSPTPGTLAAVDEEVLAGGVANAGAVLRSGRHVLRPANPHSASIHRFLAHLRAAGFDGASEPVGIDPDGRERLVFIEGAVPVPPYPHWAQTDTALASDRRADAPAARGGAGLRRGRGRLEHRDGRPGPRLGHRPDGGRWPRRLPQRRLPRERGLPRRRGRRAPRLRLRRAGPPRLRPGADGPDVRAGGRPARRRPPRLAAGRHRAGAGPAGGRRVRARGGWTARSSSTRSTDSIARGGEFVRRRVEAGEAAFVAMWESMGGMARFDRRREWWAGASEGFAAALGLTARRAGSLASPPPERRGGEERWRRTSWCTARGAARTASATSAGGCRRKDTRSSRPA